MTTRVIARFDAVEIGAAIVRPAKAMRDLVVVCWTGGTRRRYGRHRKARRAGIARRPRLTYSA